MRAAGRGWGGGAGLAVRCSDGLFAVPGVPTSVPVVVCVCVCAPGIIAALKISSALAGASVLGAEVGP